VSTDPLATGHGSLGVRTAHSGNRCLRELDRNISSTRLPAKEVL